MRHPLRPTAGARYAVERAEEHPDRLIYRGAVHLPETEVPLEVTIALPSGATSAVLLAEPPVGAPPEMAKAAAALVRAATKAELASAVPLPRKIVRWRG
jgi:hypothetical protein